LSPYRFLFCSIFLLSAANLPAQDGICFPIGEGPLGLTRGGDNIWTYNVDFNVPIGAFGALANGGVVGPTQYFLEYLTHDRYNAFRFVEVTKQQWLNTVDKGCPDGFPFGNGPFGVGISFAIGASVKPREATTAASFGHASTPLDFADFNGDGNFDLVTVTNTSVTS
jgi:hypothetical protein